MGGEGSMMAAMQSLKNNRALRNKRKKGKMSFVSSVNEKWVDPKIATFEQLMDIRKRVRRAHKLERRKVIALTILGCILLIVVWAVIPWDFIFTNTY